jgi:nucleotide-binding universal stress UspA family protein
MHSQPGGIVAGYDGSAQSGAALDWAAAEAQRRELPLTVLHAVDLRRVVPGALNPSGWPELFEREGRRIADQGVQRARKSAPKIDITGLCSRPESRIPMSNDPSPWCRRPRARPPTSRGSRVPEAVEFPRQSRSRGSRVPEAVEPFPDPDRLGHHVSTRLSVGLGSGGGTTHPQAHG